MGERNNNHRRTKAELLSDGVAQRRYGEGALFQTTLRGETVWRASRVVVDASGKRRKISGTGKSERQALDRRDKNYANFLLTNGEGQPKPKPRKKRGEKEAPSFSEVATQWLEWRKEFGIGQLGKEPLGVQAYNQYRLSLKNHLLEWGNRPVTEYTKRDVNEFFHTTLVAEKHSNSHLRALQGIVRQVFAYASEKEIIIDNPCRDVHLTPRSKKERYAKVKEENLENYGYVPDRLMAYLAPGKTQKDFMVGKVPDVKAFEKYQRLSTYEARWAMSALLALRPAEVLGLTWDRITYLNKDGTNPKELPQVAIVQQLARNPEQQGLGTKLYLKPNPKTRAGERSLPLPEELVVVLRRWKTIQAGWKKSPDWQPYPHLSNLVFTTKTGKPIRQQEDNIAWKDLLASAFTGEDPDSEHIRKLRLYSLRHLAITRMLRSGGKLAVVSEIAGHASVSITHEVYGHLDISDRVEPINAVAEKAMRERNRRKRS